MLFMYAENCKGECKEDQNSRGLFIRKQILNTAEKRLGNNFVKGEIKAYFGN